MNKKLLFILSVLIAPLLFVVPAHALTIAPTIYEVSAKPGDSANRIITITNSSTSPTKLHLEVLDASAGSEETGFAKYTKATSESTLANWITSSESEISLNTGESKRIPIFVSVPQNAEPGGHFALVSFVTTAEAGASGASITGGVGTNIALDVAGSVLEKGDIVSFTTADGKTNYDKLPIGFVTRINNGGNRHFKPQGSIQIKNMFGSVVANLPLNETNGGGNVLPRSTREFKNTWEGEFAFGKYTAVLTTDLAGAGVKTASTELWVMPAGLLVLWLIIALIIIVILVLLIKRAMQATPSMKK